MPLVTLIGRRQAWVGNKFVYMGRTTTCVECHLRRVCCDKLEPGRVYKVVNVRDLTHECPIHEGGVQVVDVEEAEAEVAIPTHQLFEGVIFTFHPNRCDQWECPHRDSCNPVGLKEGDRCRVERVVQKAGLECSRGRKLGLAVVRRIT